MPLASIYSLPQIWAQHESVLKTGATDSSFSPFYQDKQRRWQLLCSVSIQIPFPFPFLSFFPPSFLQQTCWALMNLLYLIKHESACFKQADWQFAVWCRCHVISSCCWVPGLKNSRTAVMYQGFNSCDAFWNVNSKGTKKLSIRNSAMPSGYDPLIKVCSDDIALNNLWLDLMLQSLG